MAVGPARAGNRQPAIGVSVFLHMRTLSDRKPGVLQAQVVVADGRILTVNATENADLFWGIRGGTYCQNPRTREVC